MELAEDSHGGRQRSRIIRASSGGKDRHSKVWTSKGLRDRRIRLSELTAVQLFDLQDRLGFRQPTEAVDWLLNEAADAIAELPSLNTSFLNDAPSPHGFDKERAAMEEKDENTNNCINDESDSRTASFTELLSSEHDFLYKAPQQQQMHDFFYEASQQKMDYSYESSFLGLSSTRATNYHQGSSPPQTLFSNSSSHQEIQHYFSFVPDCNHGPCPGSSSQWR